METSQLYVSAIGGLVTVIGVLVKVIHVLYKKNEFLAAQVAAFAEKMLKGEYCVNCKKNV